MSNEPTKKKPSLSQAFAELEKITAEFEHGEIDLEKGIPKLKRGLELARYLKTRLKKIENEIEEVTVDFKDLEKEKETQEEVRSNEIDTEKIPF